MTILSGTVHEVSQIETRGNKGFQRRRLVLAFVGDKTVGQRGDQLVEIEATYERMAKLDGVKVGDEVACKVAIGGRKWNDKFYVQADLVDIKVTKAAVAQPAAPAKVDSWADEVPF